MSLPPLRIGLTGGIGSGKSLVAGFFRELGAAVVDADAIAREVMAPGGPAYDAVMRAFGSGVIGADGMLDRKALAARIFGDTAARMQLNALTHPHIRRRLAGEAERLSAQPGVEVVVLDIPLLLETTDGRYLRLDGIVVVDATDEVRLARLSARDGLSPADTRMRLEAQMPLREKVARADWVIDNNGSPEATRAQVGALWEALLERQRAR
ncbi:MAG: dephospho-CoA kinase [Bacillati bacterium ANGP1]|uniref:Dephospho-CoA kinase n=2 Tax=Candidatus Segetimicrobium genomatis TaxID=2569760 RepID=A0A537IZR2_9BACT|nr:MAG: dephospho-CoA kinase [Terrabacteria group bacterium ANGP1]